MRIFMTGGKVCLANPSPVASTSPDSDRVRSRRRHQWPEGSISHRSGIWPPAINGRVFHGVSLNRRGHGKEIPRPHVGGAAASPVTPGCQNVGPSKTK